MRVRMRVRMNVRVRQSTPNDSTICCECYIDIYVHVLKI